MQDLRIRQEGERVLLILNGRLILDLPWDAALDVSRAMHQKAKLAEETAKAGRIIYDNALLFRVGAPFGLSNNPDIIRESIKTAINDRGLRRYLPGGIRSQEAVGVPTIIQRPPRRRTDDESKQV